MRPAPAWLTERPFAHRGLHRAAAGIPENSCAAFRAAIAGGYGIELDVRLAADGVAVVFHDETLRRLAGRDEAVAALSSDTLAAVTIFGTGETIPSLARVLALVDGRAPILVELKNPSLQIGPLEAAVWAALRDYDGPFAVTSFNPYSVGWFAEHAPGAARGQVAERMPPAGRRRPKALERQRLQLNHVSRPDFIAYDVHGLPHAAPLAARRAGLPLLTWTVRSLADRQIAVAWTDNMIFEGFLP